MAWPSKIVSSVTLASAPFLELPRGEGELLLVAGHGAYELAVSVDGLLSTPVFPSPSGMDSLLSTALCSLGCPIRFEVPQHGVFAVPVPGLPEDRGSVLAGADRLLKPPHLPQRRAKIVQHTAFADRRLGTITRSDVQAFVSAVSGKAAPSTTETVYAVLRAMMQHAVDNDPQVIPASPCTRIKLPKPCKRVVEPLSAAAVLALLDAITPRYRVAVALGVGLGLREGEAFGLTVPRVDFQRRKIQVLSQAQRGQLAADLKTEASTRTIPADDWVLNEISANVQRFGAGPGEVIVTNRLGKVARRNSFGDRWRLAVADARTCGKPSAPAFEGGRCGETCADPAHCLPKGTRFHDLRHYADAWVMCPAVKFPLVEVAEPVLRSA